MIRRGDRRPFYAPAKYVVELRPGEVEAAHQRQHRREMTSRTASGVGGGGLWQFNANKNRPGRSFFSITHFSALVFKYVPTPSSLWIINNYLAKNVGVHNIQTQIILGGKNADH